LDAAAVVADFATDFAAGLVVGFGDLTAMDVVKRGLRYDEVLHEVCRSVPERRVSCAKTGP
jgi:hypothetical protein